ncbi:MAG TPA: VOC family protein [Candidatus Saccharimonadales bacterium]|nr:VOC family protein [Candidatus Saccharimonadales bacterium]
MKLYPNNFELVRAFYESGLGFTVTNSWDRGENDKGVMFDVGGTTLELLSPEDGYKPITGCDFSLEVDDVRQLWEQMKDDNTVRHELRHNSWGDTSFRIADPEGFEITFFTKDSK